MNSLRGQYDVCDSLSKTLPHGHRCKLRASVSVCMCVSMRASVCTGSCCGREWHRWHGAPAVPRASDRHVAHGQPHTTYAKGRRERERKREREFGRKCFPNYHMGPQVSCLAPYAVSVSVYLPVCLPVSLPTEQSAVNGQTVSAKMMGHAMLLGRCLPQP